MFCDYLEEALYPHSEQQLPPLVSYAIKLVLVASVTYLNVRGVDVVGKAAVMFSLLVMAPFVTMVAMGMPRAGAYTRSQFSST
jgi:amino acid transporter